LAVQALPERESSGVNSATPGRIVADAAGAHRGAAVATPGTRTRRRLTVDTAMRRITRRTVGTT
jgi:hypothetical protein